MNNCPKVVEHLRSFPEIFLRFPKMSEDFRGRSDVSIADQDLLARLTFNKGEQLA